MGLGRAFFNAAKTVWNLSQLGYAGVGSWFTGREQRLGAMILGQIPGVRNLDEYVSSAATQTSIGISLFILTCTWPGSAGSGQQSGMAPALDIMPLAP